MGEQRQHQRIDCAEKCLLFYANSRYSGVVRNISISGAMVMLYGPAPGVIMPGEACRLLLSNDPENSFYKYKSRITRVSPSEIGLEILEHEF